MDDKDLNDRITGAEIDRVTAVQLKDEQLPTTPDVGQRDLGANQATTGWYPGFRGFYPYESKNDFAQKQDEQWPTPADVGVRDLTAPQHGTQWYPGSRRFYDYENANDYHQKSNDQLPTTPDVGKRDLGAN